MSTRRIKQPQLGFAAVWPSVRPPGAVTPSSHEGSHEVRVLVNGVEFHFLPQEHVILKQLVMARGKTVPLTKLSREVLGRYTLQGVIGRLKARFAKAPHIQITHVVGNGYALKGISDLSDPLP